MNLGGLMFHLKKSLVLLVASLAATATLSACNQQPEERVSRIAASGSGVTVDVVTTDSWNTGFNGAVRVSNTAFAGTINSYEVVFKLAGNAAVSGSAWVGTITAPDASGNRTATNPSWMSPFAVGQKFDQGFGGSGTFSGSSIVSLKVNGQTISLGTGGGDTTAPIVSLSSSASTVTTASSITLSATATDNVGVSKVEFYDGATLLGTDSAAPFAQSANLTSANNGTRSYTAKAFDAAGNTKTSSAVSVTVNIAVSTDTTPPTVSLSSSATNVTTASSITLTATASDNVGVSKVEFYDGTTLLGVDSATPFTQTVSLTSASNGTRSYTAKAFDVAGNNKTSSAVSVIVNIPVVVGTRLDNPFVGAKWYVNQDWATKAKADGGTAIAGYNTAVWMDRIGAIAPTDPTQMGLRAHLDAAVTQGANVFLLVVYDLPNRDCFALASNGELKIKENGFNRYKNEYVTPMAAILGDVKYKNIRIIAVIEPDSLPNLVTNTSDPDCQEAAGAGGYVEATQFTLNTLYPITNVYSYIDIGHSGWLGWADNFSRATTLIANAIKGTTNGVNSIAGFVSNTANTTPTTEPFLDALSSSALPGSNGGTQVRQAKFYEWNTYFSELPYATAWRTQMVSLGFPSTIGMLIDTSRNGWGGMGRPTALSTSTDLETFVNSSRIDRRTHRGMWCNQAGGIGERPTVAPAAGIDAYVWVKPPGESDGVATAGIIDPTDPAKGFDRFCDPTYTVPSNGFITGALPNAPHAGRWFTDGFKILLKNAFPAL
jgi:cellulose 1,4-beta-cellobiosidase